MAVYSVLLCADDELIRSLQTVRLPWQVYERAN